MMKTSFKKTITVALLVTIVFSTSFFIQPKKADAAAASCLIGQFGSLIGGLGSVVGSIMSVPVNSTVLNQTTGQTAGASTGTNIGQCLLQVLARVAAQTLIHSFTQSTIQWINSGFHGSPSFVTNPEGFFSNVGDIAAGQFIQGLGDVGQILCSPFDLKLRISLGLSLGTTNKYQYLGCRLSDVQKNIYDGFVGGNWGGSKGWENFISISQGSNNPYGAYLYTRDAMSQQILKKVGSKERELQLGSGFLSKETCYDNAGGGEINPNEADFVGYYDYTCEIVTPGSTIQANLNKTLGIPADTLSVSQDIDDILNALVNQGITQVFSATGLLGTSRNSAQYNGRTYLSNMVSTYQGQLAAGQTLPPTGINCSKTYRANDNKTVDVLLVTGAGSTWESATTSSGSIITVPITQTPAQFQNQIVRGCQNLAAAAPAQNVINGIYGPGGISEGGTSPDTCATTPPAIKNLALGAPIYAHYDMQTQRYSAQPVTVLVDGNLGNAQTSYIYQSSELYSTNYFQINLTNPSDIKYLAISPAIEDYFDSYLAETEIYFYNKIPTGITDTSGLVKTVYVAKTKDQVKTPPGIAFDGSSLFYIGDRGTTRPGNTLQTIVASDLEDHHFNLTGIKSIIVNRPVSGGYMIMSEFQAWGYDETNSGSSSCPGSSGGPAQSSVAITSQNISNLDIYQGNSFNNNGNLTISSSEDLPALTIKTSLSKVTGVDTTSVAINSIFSNNFRESRSIVYGQLNPDILFGPADPGNNISLNVAVPSAGTKTYYLTVQGSVLPNATVGTYQLTVDITETGTALSVGTQTYTFDVLSASE